MSSAVVQGDPLPPASDAATRPDADESGGDALEDDKMFRVRSGTAVIHVKPLFDLEAAIVAQSATGRTDVTKVTPLPYPKEYAHIFASLDVSRGDTYVAHGPVSKPGKDKNWEILITRRGYYKINPKTRQPEWRCEIKELAEVEPVGAKTIRLHRRVAQSVVSKGTGLFGNWKKKKELVASTIKSRDFVCDTAQRRDDWVFALQRLVRDAWQEVLESGPFMPTPEVYQAHMFITKLNKKNQPQVRVICVSDRRIFNVEPKGVDVATVKWALPIDALRSIDVQASDGLSFTLYMDTSSADKQNMKPAVGFLASDPDQRRFVEEELCRVYQNATGSELKVYRA